jgi:hypothetical protein
MVIVNGVVTVDRGAHTGAHAGRALFHRRDTAESKGGSD